MASITTPGIGSGVDIKALVGAYIDAQVTPFEANTKAKEERFTAQISAYGSINSQLSDLQKAISALANDKLGDSRKMTLSSADYFSATITEDADPSSFDVNVKQLATEHKLTSGAFEMPDKDNPKDTTGNLGKTGVIVIKAGDESFEIDIEQVLRDKIASIDEEVANQEGKDDIPVEDLIDPNAPVFVTIEDIKDAINDNAANFGVNASMVSTDAGAHLILNSTETGKENEISIAVYKEYSSSDPEKNVPISSNRKIAALAYDADLANDAAEAEAQYQAAIENGTYIEKDLKVLEDAAKAAREKADQANKMTEISAAQDAVIEVDGMEVTRSSNTFSDVIPGVELKLAAVHDQDEDDSTTITIKEDSSGIAGTINAFVTAYNKFVELSGSVQYSNVDAEITAALSGDATMRMLDQQLRGAITGNYGDGGLNVLSQFGITTNRETGLLEVDKTKLDEAISASPDDVKSFLIGDSKTGGLADKLQSVMDLYSGSKGILSTRVDTLTGQVERLDIERDSFYERIEEKEAQYFDRFNAMDIQVANLNSTLNFVTSTLANLNVSGKKDD